MSSDLMKRLLPILVLIFISIAPLRALDLQDLLETSSDLENDWYYSDWLGYFKTLDDPNLEVGHIYHNEHGVWYVTDYHDPVDDTYWIVIDSSMSDPDTTLGLDPELYPDIIPRWVDGSFDANLSYLVGTAPFRRFLNQTLSVEETWYGGGDYTPNGPNGPVPAWWKDFGMVNLSKDSDNFAPLLVGQLKHIAVNIEAYLDCRLGLSEEDWVDAFSLYGVPYNPIDTLEPATDGTDYKVASVGQLKLIAAGVYSILATHAPEYDIYGRLLDLGISPDIWTVRGLQFLLPEYAGMGNNSAPANIGQLKLLFSFDEVGLIGIPCLPSGVQLETRSPPGSDLTVPDFDTVQLSEDSYPDIVLSWKSFFTTTKKYGNWWQSEWAGWYYVNPMDQTYIDLSGTTEGWFFHEDHGWTWLESLTNTDEFFAQDTRGLGNYYVKKGWSGSNGKIGWLYSFKFSQWIWYYSRTESPKAGRWFTYLTPSNNTASFFIADDGDGDGGYGDYLPDDWEVNYFGDIESQDSLMDYDGDGLVNWYEWTYSLDPTFAYSSNEVYPDGTLVWLKSGNIHEDPNNTDLFGSWEDASAFARDAVSQSGLAPAIEYHGINNVQVAHFIDNNGNPAADDFITTVDWSSTDLNQFTVVWLMKAENVDDHNITISGGAWNGSFALNTISANDGSAGIRVTGPLLTSEVVSMGPGLGADSIEPGTFEIDLWALYLFSFDNGIGRLYKNGVLIAEKSGMGTPGPWTDLSISCQEGYFAEVVVLATILSQTEVNDLVDYYEDKTGFIKADRDGDGILDSWEMEAFGDLDYLDDMSAFSHNLSIQIDTPADDPSLY